MKKTSTLSLALVLAAAMSASPVLAQGNGKSHGRGNQEVRRDRDDDRRDDRRWDRDDDQRGRDDRRWDRRDGSGVRWVLSRDGRTLTRNGRRVPPGWCIGRGNPHNTPANCGGWQWNSRRSIWDRIGIGSGDRRDDRRWDDRRDVYGSGGSYSRTHSDFHRAHDRRCDQLAAQAGRNLRRLVEVRAQCTADHDAWHRRAGTRH